MNNYNIIFLKERKKKLLFLKTEIQLVLNQFVKKNNKIGVFTKLHFLKRKHLDKKILTKSCYLTRRYKTIINFLAISRHTLRTQVDRGYITLRKKTW